MTASTALPASRRPALRPSPYRRIHAVPSAPDDTPATYEFIDSSGVPASMPMAEWQAHLREDSQFGNIEWLCENGGFTPAWRGRDIVLVFAPHDDMVAPFSLKLEFVRGENTLMMGLGVPACIPARGLTRSGAPRSTTRA
jgi:hypothetical protein